MTRKKAANGNGRKKSKGGKKGGAGTGQHQDSLAFAHVAAQFERLRQFGPSPSCGSRGNSNGFNICLHGVHEASEAPIILSVLQDFVMTFVQLYNEAIHCVGDVHDSFMIARNTTDVEYPSLWKNRAILKWLTAYFVFVATEQVLRGNIKAACVDASSFAVWFEENNKAIGIGENWVRFRFIKVLEMQNADQHTLVGYLKHHIPCSCLDAKYEEVKGIARIGICANDLCRKRVERCSMVRCMFCRINLVTARKNVGTSVGQSTKSSASWDHFDRGQSQSSAEVACASYPEMCIETTHLRAAMSTRLDVSLNFKVDIEADKPYSLGSFSFHSDPDHLLLSNHGSHLTSSQSCVRT